MTEPAARYWKAAALLALLVAVFVLIYRSAWVAEDAYITLRSVDNWMNGLGPRWNAAERVQSFTHPLWMLLLSGAYYFTREGFFTTVYVSLAVSYLALAILVATNRQRPLSLAVALIALGSSKAFVDYSTSGLENPLSHCLLLLAVWVYWDKPASLRSFGLLALLTALGVLNRMDTLLLYLPLLVTRGLEVGRREGLPRLLAMTLLAFLPFIIWELFSLFYFGFPFPNTAYAKLNTGTPGLKLLGQGFLYLADSVMRDPAIALLFAAGLGIGIVRRRELGSLPLVVAILLYLAYVLKIGGDFMSGRFLVAPALFAACIIARSSLRPGWATALATACLALSLASPRSPFYVDEHYGWRPKEDIRWGIADEKAFYYQTSRLLGSSFDDPPPHQYWAKQGKRIHEKTLVPGRVIWRRAVGYHGYFAGPLIHVVDGMALTDPLLARLPSRQDETWRIGHFERVQPEGYLETLRNGEDLFVDPELGEYFAHLALVTRGELWSWERMKTLVAMNLGLYDHLLENERERVRTLVPYWVRENKPPPGRR